jgi:pimeloyl-ACP methyl ester carboxylesterase
MIWIVRTLFALLAVYLAFATLVFVGQRKMIYFPPNHYEAPPAGFSEITTTDGAIGWHVPALDGKPTVMVFHGNASAIDNNMHIFRELVSAGYGVWSVGYPGYPGNTGSPTQSAISAAALLQYDALCELGVENIVFYGTSLGSAVAAQLAAERQPDLLILDAPFNSMADMTKMHMRFLPTQILLKDKWQSHEAIAGLNVPIIWLHGTKDQVIPLAQGQKLFDGYAGPKSAHVLRGAHHTNTWFHGGREITLEAISKL